MVFKRRDRKPIYLRIIHFFWPKGGWRRALAYMSHRLKRLPGSPEMIGRGVAAGVFAAFTPFYGFHFIFAVLLAMLVRGNVVAAFFATLFGNPLTYIPIGLICISVGYFMLGLSFDEAGPRELVDLLLASFPEMTRNFVALFTDEQVQWVVLPLVRDQVLWPYLLGGVPPGALAAYLCYVPTVSFVRRYQHSRRERGLKAGISALAKKTTQAIHHHKTKPPKALPSSQKR